MVAPCARLGHAPQVVRKVPLHIRYIHVRMLAHALDGHMSEGCIVSGCPVQLIRKGPELHRQAAPQQIASQHASSKRRHKLSKTQLPYNHQASTSVILILPAKHCQPYKYGSLQEACHMQHVCNAFFNACDTQAVNSSSTLLL